MRSSLVLWPFTSLREVGFRAERLLGSEAEPYSRAVLDITRLVGDAVRVDAAAIALARRFHAARRELFEVKAAIEALWEASAGPDECADVHTVRTEVFRRFMLGAGNSKSPAQARE